MNNKKSFVNLTVNPCKMCMPMGGVMALKGIEKTMVIIHGSQGCSTYIRRHMATHYNEPIDIASSSLSEKGTVYGGADNLKKGINNLVKMYEPKVVGVLTTCLAETIGEDIAGIINELKGEGNLDEVEIIPLSTPGYGGTQWEGYYGTLRGIVENLSKDNTPNNKINIIAPNLNPGDIRALKEMIEAFGIDYIMLPDVSETLDGTFKSEYNHIPEGGTDIRDIKNMAGSLATIEFGTVVSDRLSPGTYLNETYGIPLFKCNFPIGLENTDEFLHILSILSKRPIPSKYLKQRGRYLDALIDAHKYNGEAKVIIYGEPDLCVALMKLSSECGMSPVLVALGTVCEKAKEQMKAISEEMFSNCVIMDDCDFEIIEKKAIELKANLMMGNSDGRRIEHKRGISLVRVGFPIHDRIGGQRKTVVGFEGSTALIEETANSLLSRKETSYREEMYDNYFKKPLEAKVVKSMEKDNINKEERTAVHPCFSEGAHKYARMHIPVAPACNISCNYCSRKFDCVNESRPGVTSEVLSPEQALVKFKEVKAKIPNLTVIGIAGPGDALANFAQTKKSIELIREEDPSMTFCLSTNGLMLPFYAEEIVELGITHVTVTINTIDPKIGAKLYKEVNYLGNKYVGEEGAQILLNNQLAGLQYLTHRGVTCKVNIVMVKGVNDAAIPDVVKKVKEFGVFMTNIMQMIPAPGSVFEDMPLVTQKELNEMRKDCEVDLKQMYHCRQCRADAIGTLSHDRSLEFSCACKSTHKKEASIEKSEEKAAIVAKFAVASKTGINVDQHFGHAEEFYIYEYDAKGNISFIEKRTVSKYCNGKEDCEHEDKIDKMFNIIKDCDYVLAMRAGDEPVRRLKSFGINVVLMYENIYKAIEKTVATAKCYN